MENSVLGSHHSTGPAWTLFFLSFIFLQWGASTWALEYFYTQALISSHSYINMHTRQYHGWGQLHINLEYINWKRAVRLQWRFSFSICSLNFISLPELMELEWNWPHLFSDKQTQTPIQDIYVTVCPKNSKLFLCRCSSPISPFLSCLSAHRLIIDWRTSCHLSMAGLGGCLWTLGGMFLP